VIHVREQLRRKKKKERRKKKEERRRRRRRTCGSKKEGEGRKAKIRKRYKPKRYKPDLNFFLSFPFLPFPSQSKKEGCQNLLNHFGNLVTNWELWDLSCDVCDEQEA